MTEVMAADVPGGITRGWTGGTGSTQAAAPAMAWNWAAPDHGVTYRASKGTNCHGYEITIATVCVYVNEDGGMLSADTGELMAIQ